MATGYEDIDRLTNQQNNLINEQERKQNELINQQTQMQVDELNREKDKIEQDTIKTTKGLYSNWQKQANQYGANAEQLAQQGLAHSGYAETTQTALYNTYQKNVTETLNNARDLKSDYDLLCKQAEYVKKGGTLLYSTCTLVRRENEGVVEAFLKYRPDFETVPLDLPPVFPVNKTGMLTLVPGEYDTDGFFICRLRRKA